jgi:hypothetical protein
MLPGSLLGSWTFYELSGSTDIAKSQGFYSGARTSVTVGFQNLDRVELSLHKE